jgi:hypothetical protein
MPMSLLYLVAGLVREALDPEREAQPEYDGAGMWRREAAGPHDRQTRIENEVLMIAPRFSDRGGVLYDESNSDWLIIPKYPLPERWKERWCKLLIIFPETYPISAPIGFYLDRQFELSSGGSDPHLVGFGAHHAPDLRVSGWHWYCVRPKPGDAGGWRPSPDYRQPDNLWTFLTSVREVLTNDA